MSRFKPLTLLALLIFTGQARGSVDEIAVIPIGDEAKGVAYQISNRQESGRTISAAVLWVETFRAEDGRRMSRTVWFHDAAVSRNATELSPGSHIITPRFGRNPGTRVEARVCGVVFADGTLTGEEACRKQILDRRRSLLLAAKQTDAVLAEAQAQRLSRAEVLERLQGIRAPHPWEAAAPQVGEESGEHATVRGVMQMLSGLRDESSMPKAVDQIRGTLRERIARIEAARPALD